MQASIELAIAGHSAIYCPDTLVIGRLMNQESALSQRSRWEHGHLEIITTEVPRLLVESIRQKRIDLAGLALDLAVPPLSLLIGGWLGVTGIALVLGLLTAFWWPLLVLGLEGLVLLGSILMVWTKFERYGLKLSDLLNAPFYILWKIPIYVKYLVAPQTRWLRTERDE